MAEKDLARKGIGGIRFPEVPLNLGVFLFYSVLDNWILEQNEYRALMSLKSKCARLTEIQNLNRSWIDESIFMAS